MSLAIKQIAARDRQAEHRSYKRPFAADAHGEVVEYGREWFAGGQDDYQLTLERMTDVRLFNQFVSNANDGISMVQIALDALAETGAVLDDLYKFSDVESPDYQFEPEHRVSCLKRVQNISEEASYDHKKLLDGELGVVSYSVGEGRGGTINIPLSDCSPVGLGFGNNFEDIVKQWQEPRNSPSGEVAEQEKIARIDEAQVSVADLQATLAPLPERFANALEELHRLVGSTQEARKRFQDDQVAAEAVQLAKNTMLSQAKISIIAQANQQALVAMRLLED